MLRSLLMPLLALLIVASLAASCGGIGQVAGGGVGGTGITSGPVTGFGSVFVNGIEFDTGSAEIVVRGEPADEAALGLGMLVVVTGTVNADGVTGDAELVEYSSAIEGPVSELAVSPDGTGLLVVLGQSVEIRSSTVFDGGDTGITTLDAVPLDALVEVSGYTDGTGMIVATRVEVRAVEWSGETIEVTGIIQDLANDTFRLGELTVTWSEVTMLPAEPLVNGLYVKVISTRGYDAENRLVAERIEVEDSGVVGVGEEGEEVDIRGIVTQALSGDVFYLNGQPVRVTAETEFEEGTPSDLVVGVEIKVEGTVVNGEILADEVKLEHEDEDSDSSTDSDSDSQSDSDSSSDSDSNTDSDSASDPDSSTDSDSTSD